MILLSPKITQNVAIPWQSNLYCAMLVDVWAKSATSNYLRKIAGFETQ